MSEPERIDVLVERLKARTADIVSWCVKRTAGRPPMPMDQIIALGTERLTDAAQPLATEIIRLREERDELATTLMSHIGRCTEEMDRAQAAETNVGRLRKALLEAEARRIYEGWRDRPGFAPWVSAGNSRKQEEARAEARAVLSELEIGGEPKS